MKYNKEDVEKFAKSALPILKEFGYIKKTNYFFMFSIFVAGVFVATAIFYGIYTDAFKDEINQSVSMEPQINVDNQYEFTPSTDNKYNITLKPNYTINNFNNIVVECNQTI